MLFSTGLGIGLILTYNSYLPKHDDIPLGSGVFAVVGNTSVGLLAIFAIYPIIFAFGIEPTAGTELVFVALPNIFPQMPAGWFWTIVFFISFFFAAFTSGLALTEVAVTPLKEETRLDRKGAVLVISIIIWLLGLPSAYSTDFQQFMDFMVGNWGYTLGMLLIVLTVGWTIGPESIRVVALNQNSHIYIDQWWNMLIQYFIPVVVGVIIIYFITSNIFITPIRTIGGIVVLCITCVLSMRVIRSDDETNIILKKTGGD